MLLTVVALTCFLWHQEYDTTHKQLEAVRAERDEAKREFSAMKKTHGPRLSKIQQIDQQLTEIEAQIKTKVGKVHFISSLTGLHDEK